MATSSHYYGRLLYLPAKWSQVAALGYPEVVAMVDIMRASVQIMNLLVMISNMYS